MSTWLARDFYARILAKPTSHVSMPCVRLLSLPTRDLKQIGVLSQTYIMSAGMLQRPALGQSVFGSRSPVLRCPVPVSRKTASSVTACSSKKQDVESLHVAKVAGVALAASLLLSAVVPEDALAARSGGRVGGSSFRSSAPRAAPRAAPSPRSGCVCLLRFQHLAHLPAGP